MLKTKKKVQQLLIFTLIFIFVIGLAACEEKTDPIDEGPELVTIESALTSADQGDDIRIKGTIYYVQENGIYLSDSLLGNIFVSTSTLPDEAFDLIVGLEIELVGIFERNQNKPIVTAVSYLELLNDSADPVLAVRTNVADLLALDPAASTGSWYRFVELTGVIKTDPVTLQQVLVDDFGDEIAFSNLSNTTALDANSEERITMHAVLGEYSTFGNEWRMIFTGSEFDILATPFTLTEVEALISAWLPTLVPAELLGTLVLPAVFELIPEVLITWSTDLDGLVEIMPLGEGDTTYETNIFLPLDDTVGTLTATIFYGEEDPFDLILDITVKALMTTGLKDALESEAELVMFEAVVIGFAETQTASQKSMLVQDLNHPNVVITVDYSLIDTNDYGLLSAVQPEIGDVVLVAGTYRQEGRPSIVDPFITELTGVTQAPVYDFENAYEMSNSSNWRNFPGHQTFVKLVNPYMRYSTSSLPGPTNWIRLGYDVDSVGTHYGYENNKSFAFLIRPVDEMLGNIWRDMLDIPLVGQEAKIYDGTIYAFIVYETGTYLQLVIVDPSHVFPSDALSVEQYLRLSIDARQEEGDLSLPTTHALIDGEFTWTSSNLDIVSNTGKVTYPELDTVVNLTVEYVIDGEPYSLTLDVLIVGQIKVVLQVSDVLAMTEEGEPFNVEGIVLSAGYNTASGLSDIFLQDKETGQVMIVQGLLGFEEDFNIGDLIEFNATLFISATDNEAGKKVIMFNTNFVVLAINQTLLDYRQHAILVDSHETAIDLLSFENRVVGAVYFFSGEYFINGTTSAYSPGSLNARFHLNPNASGIAGIRYGTKTMVLNDNGNRPILGDDWVIDILGITAENYPGTSYPGLVYNGGFYAVLKNITNSYYYWSVISVDDFIFETELEGLQREIAETVPENIAAGDIELILTHPLVTGEIVWASSNDAVISPEGVVTYGDVDVTVTLTATFIYEDVVYHVEILVTVLALEPMSVSEVLLTANDGDIVMVSGIVVGFHWNGSGTRNALTNGVVIKEALGNDLLYVIGLYGNFGETLFEYNVDGHILALGDEIEFNAVFSVSITPGFAGRNTLTIETAELANMKIMNTNVPYVFDLENAIVIEDDIALDAAMENLTYGQLYKFKGAFSFRGSATGYGTGINFVPSFTNSVLSDYNSNPSWADRAQRFSFKFDGNVPNLGDLWWETLLNVNAENYGGTALDAHQYDEDSYIYFFVGNALPSAVGTFGYIQLMILDESFISTNRVFNQA